MAVVDLLRDCYHAWDKNRRNAPRVARGTRVLDVGGGQSVHRRAAAVLEKYPADSFERPGQGVMDQAKPLVVGDGENIPFADMTFDYVIASHVLEHATDPKQFASELARIAPRGYVEVPSREAELVFGWPFHPWLIDHVGGCLYFEPRNGAIAPCGEAMHAEFVASPLLRLAWAARRECWLHSLHWKEAINIETRGPSNATQTAIFDLEKTTSFLSRTNFPAPPVWIREATRCPACRGKLIWKRLLECDECGRTYPLVRSVPILLKEAAVP